jgi:hypothetical protein
MKSLIRIFLICACGGAIVYWALTMRQSARPQAAPLEIQQEGRAHLHAQLRTIQDTEFGRSLRGQVLSARISAFLEQDRIIFTSELADGENAICVKELLGDETWYILVTKGSDGRYVQLNAQQIAEVTFHEALHSVQGGLHNGSIQEECDAFVAGLQAEAASQGVETLDVITLEGVPVAQFVNRKYIGLSQKPDYQPVVESLDWLKKRSGL